MLVPLIPNNCSFVFQTNGVISFSFLQFHSCLFTINSGSYRSLAHLWSRANYLLDLSRVDIFCRPHLLLSARETMSGICVGIVCGKVCEISFLSGYSRWMQVLATSVGDRDRIRAMNREIDLDPAGSVRILGILEF